MGATPMHSSDGHLLLTATDLVDFLGCEHLTQLELAVARGDLQRPARNDPGLDILSGRGQEHEQRYLDQLRAQGREVVEIPWTGAGLAGMRAAHAATVAALRRGVDVIYQGALFDGRWRGYPDFLFRVDTPSKLGTFRYEVGDTKLARSVKTQALLQLCHYSELLAQVQGREPQRIRLILGDGTERTYRLRDFSAYHRWVKRRFEDVVEGQPRETYPDPVEQCGVCAWADVCAQRRRDDDHLSLVAGIRRDQVRKLNRADIITVESLARVEGPVQGIGRDALKRLAHQARLQHHARLQEQGPTRKVIYDLLPPTPGAGLCLLPPPSPGDLFFDMEGDPHVEDGGLEYLFGVVEVLPGGKPRFHAFWAHARAQEKRAFESFIDFVMARRQRHPDLHVYHYAPYEPTAIKRLMGVHGTREAEVDQLLRGGVFVDLYQVVRQGMRVSQESYSIKQLEPLYMPPREGAIKDAGSSIVAYERWLQSRDASLLDSIAAYNEDDCVSTWKLRDWLEERRIDLANSTGAELPRPEPRQPEPSETQTEAQARVQALVDALTVDVPDDPSARTDEQQARWLLAQLLSWHRREDKPAWWAYFERQRLTEEELIEDSEAIGGLTYDGVHAEVARSLVHRYRFDPSQDHKILVGASPHDPQTAKPVGEVVALDPVRGYVHLKRGKASKVPHPRALIPEPPIDTRILRQALERLAAWVVENGIDAPGPYRAARDLLLGRPPRINGSAAIEPLVRADETPADAARRLVASLDQTYLPIQGPPGSGKTYTGARMVLDLVKQGRRVGITAFSHKAIGNLLDEVARHARQEGIPVRALQKASEADRCSSPDVKSTESNADVETALQVGTVDVIAGTCWLFAREQLVDTLDTLFVDEAGQLSLANTLAVAGAARNLVLLGDPQQLAQPLTGSHPPGAEKSALSHILGEHATVPPERGILLDTTWRMHPAICAFISEVAYDDRLKSHPSCAVQALGEISPSPHEESAGVSGADANSMKGTGLRYLPLRHDGNRTASAEEADLVAQCIQALLSREWTDRNGISRPITLEDILVVAPYNAQVLQVSQRLLAGARVGTVDKFQGQEAPVVLFTTAASSGEDIPRGLDFLFSLNRLNVAISRARGLAALVSSASLLHVRCHTPEQMRLLNAFCRLLELAEP
jgi:predicted RecB family nuclease